MNAVAIQNLRKKLANQQTVFGLWITLESPSISAIAVELGLDWIIIDLEHGHLDWKEVLEHVRSTLRSNTVVLVRLNELNKGQIKRVLDIGADGIVIPTIESADQVREALNYSKYPPEGVRGMGGEMATGWGLKFKEHIAEANDHVLVIPILETIEAKKQISDILSVEGIDLIYLGPADYSASAGYPGNWEGSGVAEDLLEMKDAIVNSGKNCGIIAMSPEELKLRLSQNFKMIGIGLDTSMLIRGIQTTLGSNPPLSK